jgi:hypothetical protein
VQPSKLDKIGNIRFIGKGGHEFKWIVAKLVKMRRLTAQRIVKARTVDDQRWIQPKRECARCFALYLN